MRLSVDGRGVDVPAGSSLLDAARAAGAQIPTLCHDERVGASGSCRICLVGVSGEPAPVPACTTAAFDGAEVRTSDPAAREAARGVLGLLLAGLPGRALDVPAERSELVRACAALDVDGATLDATLPRRGVDFSHPYIKLDRDLCIACGRCVRLCDEVQGQFALTLEGRGFDAVVAAGAGERWVDSPCVACGTCADGCPTGALSEPGLRDPRPIDRRVETTCGYCGVGCTLEAHVRDNRVAALTPAPGAPVNRGHACVKGRFAHGFASSPERLTAPLLRRGGRLEPATWVEALREVAGRLARIRAEQGPDAIAAVSSARGTNEESYLVQKLMRSVIGTNNVDNCARVCHAPSAAALKAAFGLGGGTNCLEDLDVADAVLVVGANVTEAHPVVGSRITQRAIAGGRLVVVDPRRIGLADYADVHLRPWPGTNVPLLHGLARVLLDDGLVDRTFVATRAQGWDELLERLAEFPPPRVAAITGVPEDDLRRAAHLYGEAASRSIVYGLGVTEHRQGTDAVRALANLAILTGSVGVEGQGGILPLRGQNNVQGASDMGALPDVLPGYQPVADPDVRRRFAAAWGCSLPTAPGLRIPDALAGARRGDVRALLVIGEDLAHSQANAAEVEAALDACELVVCHELFLSRTAARADVVLPAASFLEKDGTFVNFDRRVQRVRPVVAPPGEALPDFEIVRRLALALGKDLGCATPSDAWDEMAALTPPFGGISHARLDAARAIHWPCASPADPGAPRLYGQGFATPSGRAQLAAPEWEAPGETPDASYPLLLVTGRRLEHYNAGTMTRRTPNLELSSTERVELHPADAAALGIGDGDRVEVRSRRGAVEAPAQVTDRVLPGQVFMGFHFPGVLTNALTSDAVDTATACPEYKVTAIRVRRADGDRGSRAATSG